jgi:hypothetical protein
MLAIYEFSNTFYVSDLHWIFIVIAQIAAVNPTWTERNYWQRIPELHARNLFKAANVPSTPMAMFIHIHPLPNSPDLHLKFHRPVLQPLPRRLVRFPPDQSSFN